MDKLILKTEDVEEIVNRAGKFPLDPSVEDMLLKLLRYQKDINNLVERVKDKIKEEGERLNGNFSGVVGAKITAQCRYYGEKYKFDKEKKEECMPFLKKITFYKTDAEKVDQYMQDNKNLPTGIIKSERKKTINFVLKDEQQIES